MVGSERRPGDGVIKIMVVDERKELLREPYVVRVGGWTLDRYLAEAPRHLIWDFARWRR
jgi:hypothetical protein